MDNSDHNIHWEEDVQREYNHIIRRIDGPHISICTDTEVKIVLDNLNVKQAPDEESKSICSKIPE